MKKMLIQNLQREIIYLICESICPHCQNLHRDWPALGRSAHPPAAIERRQTIFNLSLICKRWGYIAQKVLHHHFGYFETHPKAEFLFCRTLSGNPELGKQVKMARIRQISVYDWSLDEEWLAKSLNKFSGTLDFPETSSVPEISKRGEFIAPLILLHVPTLNKLSMQNGHLNKTMRKFRTLFVGRQCVIPRSITTLHVEPLKNSGSYTEGSLDLSEACMVGLLTASPGVRDMSLFNPNPQSLRSRLNLSNLRTLILYADFSREELRPILSSIGPLEKFTYYGHYRSYHNGATLQDICELLRPKKHSLTRLHLETSEESQHFTAAKSLINVKDMRFVFRDFWSPTDAEPIMEEHALLDVFPPNLYVLQLDISENTILGVLDALAKYILSTFRDQIPNGYKQIGLGENQAKMPIFPKKREDNHVGHVSEDQACYTIDLQNLDAALIYITCENFCLHCYEGPGDLQNFPSVSAAQDADAKTLRYTLFSLSTVCRSWGYIAQKTLHHHFGFSEITPLAEVLFCRTLSENPELAKQVKQAFLRCIYPDDIRAEEDWLVKPLNRFSGILGLPGAEPIITGWERFIGALVLLQTPNLEYPETIAEDLSQILDKFSKPLSIHEKGFPQRLKSLDIRNKTVFLSPLDLSEGSIGGFIAALPGLQSLIVVNPNRRTLRDPLHFRNVRHIALRSTILRQEDLRLLISATGPLESFLYVGAYCYGAEFCSIQDICEILALRKNTLKALIAVAAQAAYEFTTGARLLNVRYMRMALEDIWLPGIGDEIRNDQILARGLPPCLENVHFDAAENILKEFLDAVITYIQSSYRKDPSDQVLKVVHIVVYMDSDRETMEQSPDSIHNSAVKLIQEKCGDFLKHGKVVLRAFWGDGQDEDGGDL
ncbi:hypothetical protein FDENT_9091 [Fusarium denticulatum]|uniref:Uncharacterized protein n=1 Tax=Fusarium denticulatum TaxID=48507 RepID=A0A8H5U1B5_9HYPO|nr:hypothetical protein FDENT_9091 [Fusarium denticulatum]